MKINYSCIRKLLIVLEDNLEFSENLEYPELTFSNVTELMPEYSKADIAYSTIMADEAELISAHIIEADDAFCECVYFSLTYIGHQFLENIRNNSVWEKTKKITSKIGSTSLDIISSVASNLIQNLIKQQL